VEVNQLSVARRNTAYLVAFLYIQEIFWLSVSRVQLVFYEPKYKVAEFEWVLFISYALLALIFSAVGVVAARFMRPIKRLSVSNRAVLAIIVIATSLNVFVSLTISDSARYTSGALTGLNGVVYGLSRSFSLVSMMIFVRERVNGTPLPWLWLTVFVFSLVLTVDGLAPALTIGVFLLLVSNLRINRPARVVLVVPVAVAVLWVGFHAKFHEVPAYLTQEFMARWTIARFAIPAEQMYTHLAGESIIGDQISYVKLVLRAISDRVDLLSGAPFMVEFPRSVSEALYFDLHGEYGGGSSSGAFLGTALQGAFFFVPPIVFAFLFLQYFYSLRVKVTFVQLCAYSFLFKGVHASFYEYLAVISPTLLYVGMFMLGALLVPSKKLRTSMAEAHPHWAPV